MRAIRSIAGWALAGLLLAGCEVRRPVAPMAAPTESAVAPEDVPAALPAAQAVVPAPEGLATRGADRRVDLRWTLDTAHDALIGYHVYRADAGSDDFHRLTARPHPRHLYSDFLGHNDGRYRYYVTAAWSGPGDTVLESAPSTIRSASPLAMSDEDIVTSVQEASFRFFWDYGHPVSGLARERTGGVSNDVVATGASGFGLMNIVVAVRRGFVSRADAAARVLTMLRFLSEADRFHGAWPHWLDGRTGRVIPFSKEDDGGDLVETAFLVQGLLTARRYFTGGDPVETEIRGLATRLWEEVEWDWYGRGGETGRLTWHWSPNRGWQINHQIGGFNECLVVYVLAVASPTHPVPPDFYRRGWAGPGYARERTFYGQRQWVGPDLGGPLFFTHYSFLGLDPRGWHDGFCNYFENNRGITLMHRAYCAENPGHNKDYSELVWGLTASDNPWGYAAQAPRSGDNGTITPTAALSSMPYAPEAVTPTLLHFYRAYGPRLWGEFGFRDAFNPQVDWYADSYIGIDQGPIAVMIENHRSQLCWDLFMSNPEIEPALVKMGWTRRPPGITEPAGP